MLTRPDPTPADELEQLAGMVRRLRPDWRDAEAFYEARSEMGNKTTMAEIIKPDASDEMFSFLRDGKQVWRSLREMTADEVWDAIWLHQALAERADAVVSPFKGRDDDDMPLPGEMSDQEFMAWARRKQQEADLLLKSAEVQKSYARLIRAVSSVIPEAEKDEPMLDALRRHWACKVETPPLC